MLYEVKKVVDAWSTLVSITLKMRYQDFEENYEVVHSYAIS